MAVNILKKAELISDLENFLEKVRPDESIRDDLDITYKILNQTVVIYEQRPKLDNPEEITESEIAKTTFVKSQNHWKIYWLRGNLKWYAYEPKPTVKKLNEFLAIVIEDKYGCFWG